MEPNEYLRAQIILFPTFGGNTFSIPANNNAIIIIFFVTKYLSDIIFNLITKFTIAYFTFKNAFKLRVLNNPDGNFPKFESSNSKIREAVP